VFHAFTWLGVGPTNFLKRKRFLASCPPHRIVATCAGTIWLPLLTSLNLPRHIRTIPLQVWETDKWSALLLRCLWCCGGKEPRLRNCRPAAAAESCIRDTTASLKTSLESPPGGPEEEHYWGLGYGGDIIEVSTRDWYLMFNSNSPLSGGQKHTHIEYNAEIKIVKVSNECFFRSANVFRL
jgi:hypothetical protein